MYQIKWKEMRTEVEFYKDTKPEKERETEDVLIKNSMWNPT